MGVMIAHASQDEHGKIKNGQAGDQTRKEVCIRSWYNKPWQYVIRFKDSDIAEKVARAMEMAAKNELVGYDQLQRNTLLKEARKFNYDISRVHVACETDCSALVSVACMYAGIPESTLTLNGNCATTRTLRPILKSTGEVEIFSTAAYTNKTDKLKRGDILLKEGAHVAVVVQVDKPQLKSIDEIAKEVIAGKWGSGQARRANLTDAGYNYSLVQARVNELLAKPKEIKDKPKFIWDYLMAKINNPYGVAGLMGNMQAESGLNPKNLQNSCEKKLGMTDEQYVQAVDNGTYKNFVNDGCGIGLVQWTYKTRKAALLEFKGKKSIGDLEMQLDFLWKELSTSYKTVLERLKTSLSVREASDFVLTKFERPRDQSESVKAVRASYGQTFYDKYAK